MTELNLQIVLVFGPEQQKYKDMTKFYTDPHKLTLKHNILDTLPAIRLEYQDCCRTHMTIKKTTINSILQRPQTPFSLTRKCPLSQTNHNQLSWL